MAARVAATAAAAPQSAGAGASPAADAALAARTAPASLSSAAFLGSRRALLPASAAGRLVCRGGRNAAPVVVVRADDAAEFGGPAPASPASGAGAPGVRGVKVSRAVATGAPAPAAAEVTAAERYPGYAAWNTVKQEKWEGELQVKGEIPKWLKGTYLRNGPGFWQVGEKEFEHLFDGYSCLVRVNFDNGKMVVGHNQLRSDAYTQALSNDKVMFREFKVVPDHANVFKWMADIAGMATGHTLTDNANTGVIHLGDGRVLCLTETMKGTIQIDPNTLETLGKFEYEDNFQGILHSAHPYVDDKEFITLLPDLINPGYTVVRMLAGTNTRVPIGRVPCKGKGSPGWVHSFAVTENYIVVPEMPLRYSALNLLKSEPCPYYKFEWMPDSGAWMHLMNRHTGVVEASLEVPNFVTFHFINAYEEEVAVETPAGGRPGRPARRVIVDCCEHYANPEILQRMELSHLRSVPGKVLPDARVGRFTLPLDGSRKGTLEAAVPPDQHGRGLDMNTINDAYKSRKYRYVYAAGAHRPAHFPNAITKVDLVDKTAKTFYHDGGIPSEPFFVQRPGAVEEDDGVAISLVSDDRGGGFVILFDGQSFEEIARADLPYGLPYGLHGCWVPA